MGGGGELERKAPLGPLLAQLIAITKYCAGIRGFLRSEIEALLNQRNFGAGPPISHFATENPRRWSQLGAQICNFGNWRLIQNAILRVAGISLGVQGMGNSLKTGVSVNRFAQMAVCGNLEMARWLMAYRKPGRFR